jgi:Nucleotidyl transferase AbiEii toxin, Type IV TA system
VKLTEIYDSVVAEGSSGFAEVIAVLEETGTRYAVIGGLAINAYVEPVFTADADIVIALSEIDRFTEALLGRGYTVERYPFSLNFRKLGSDLSLQISTDPMYQDFLDRIVTKDVLNVQAKVASLPDLVQGKIRAWSDPERRLSKRAKDQTDLFRIAEHYPEMINLLPEKLKADIIEDQLARLHRTRRDIPRPPLSQGEREPPGLDR